MSEITYSLITQTIGQMVKDDAGMISAYPNGYRVEVEETFEPIPDKCPWIGVYLSSWETAAGEERIGGTAPFLTKLIFDVWCYDFSLENAKGAQLRDKLMQKVKEAFKGNRKLNNTVLITRFLGGEFDNGTNSEGFFKGVSIKIEAEIRE